MSSATGPDPTSVDSAPEIWAKWNSPNHGGMFVGEGQNVLYADAHVEWMNKPCSGAAFDNIYTQWTNATGAGSWDVRSKGNISVADRQVPYGATDTMLYP